MSKILDIFAEEVKDSRGKVILVAYDYLRKLNQPK